MSSLGQLFSAHKKKTALNKELEKSILPEIIVIMKSARHRSTRDCLWALVTKKFVARQPMQRLNEIRAAVEKIRLKLSQFSPLFSSAPSAVKWTFSAIFIYINQPFWFRTCPKMNKKWKWNETKQICNTSESTYFHKPSQTMSNYDFESNLRVKR